MSEPDPTLVYDNATAGPGLHALIVGVSEYPFLPGKDDPPRDETWNFTKLTSAALSAYRVYQWLHGHKTDLRLPVKSIRLLMAPSPTEIHAEPELANLGVTTPTWDNFKNSAWAWRNSAASDPEDMTFFYFAGHGMQRGPEEGLLVMADFSKPQTANLDTCVSFGDLRIGMAPTESRPTIAQTQFYFVDACLVRPSEALKKLYNPQPRELWNRELPNADRRSAPALFSTVDNAVALGRRGQLSYFAEALIKAFEHAAEDSENGTWPVTAITLKTALDRFYEKNKVGTQVAMGGLVGSPVLRYLNRPPDVEIGIYLRPDLLAGNCALDVCDSDADRVVQQVAMCSTNPIEITLKAGVYRVFIHSQKISPNPYRSNNQPVTQRLRLWPHDLTSRILVG